MVSRAKMNGCKSTAQVVAAIRTRGISALDFFALARGEENLRRLRCREELLPDISSEELCAEVAAFEEAVAKGPAAARKYVLPEYLARYANLGHRSPANRYSKRRLEGGVPSRQQSAWH